MRSIAILPIVVVIGYLVRVHDFLDFLAVRGPFFDLLLGVGLPAVILLFLRLLLPVLLAKFAQVLELFVVETHGHHVAHHHHRHHFFHHIAVAALRFLASSGAAARLLSVVSAERTENLLE